MSLHRARFFAASHRMLMGSLLSESRGRVCCLPKMSNTLDALWCKNAIGELQRMLKELGIDESICGSGVGYRPFQGRLLPALVVKCFPPTIRDRPALTELPDTLCHMPLWIEDDDPIACFGWRNRAPRGGVGIAVQRGDRKGLGTLGCLVERRDGKVLGLTCGHVVANAKRQIVPHTPVLWRDGARKRDPDWRPLGQVEEAGGNERSNPHRWTDSALVSIDSRGSDKIERIGRVRISYLDPFYAVGLLLRVKKSGMATGLTYGRVRGIMDINIRIVEPDAEGEMKTIGYDLAPQMLEIATEDVVLCEPGDSGSLIVDAEHSGRPRGVGLLCSTSLYHRGFAVPIGRVLDFHDVSLLGRE